MRIRFLVERTARDIDILVAKILRGLGRPEPPLVLDDVRALQKLDRHYYSSVDEGPLREFIQELHDKKPPLARVPGTAIFLNRGKETAPLALRRNVEHNHVLHENVLIIDVQTLPVPHVPAGKRIDLDDLGYKDDMICHVTARFGYMDTPSVPSLLPLIRAAGGECPVDGVDVSYFLSTIEVHAGNAPDMSRWRKRLFIATTRLTADAAEYFQLPRERTVIMGSRIEV